MAFTPPEDDVIDPPTKSAHVKQSSRNVPWTPERENELWGLWMPNKFSASQIANLMGLTRNSVLGKVFRMGLPSHKENNAGKPKTVRGNAPVRVRAPLVLQPIAKEPEPSPVPFLAITFDQLEPHHCRFPRGETSPFTFCGQPIKEGKSYCPYHCHIVYTASRPKSEYWPSFVPRAVR